MQEIGVSLKKTEKVYESAFSKLNSGKGNLIGRAKKIEALGGKGSKSLPEDLIGSDEE
jgi:DNA recombination protein RmuC